MINFKLRNKFLGFIVCCFMAVLAININVKAEETDEYEVSTSYVLLVNANTDVLETNGPNKTVVGHLVKGTNYDVKSTDGNWAVVNVDGIDGYVMIDGSKICLTSKNEAIALTKETNERKRLVDLAGRFVGKPYVWGGVNPNTGTDCSGFTMFLYKSIGVNLPHSSVEQSTYGSIISTDQLKPGDLIFYGGKHISHVAMYIGNGLICHASSERTGIKISPMNYKKPSKCVSLF